MEAGWVVTEVGRQPWIVYDYMKVEDAATGNTGVWITFLAVVVLYLGARRDDDPGAAAMSRRSARATPRDVTDATTCPTGRSTPRGPPSDVKVPSE